MIADVIWWNVKDDFLASDLNESIQWVIEQQFNDRTRPEDQMPEVFLCWPEYPHDIVEKGGNQGVSWRSGAYQYLVVADENLTPQQATVVVTEFLRRQQAHVPDSYKLMKEVIDGNVQLEQSDSGSSG